MQLAERLRCTGDEQIDEILEVVLVGIAVEAEHQLGEIAAGRVIEELGEDVDELAVESGSA